MNRHITRAFAAAAILPLVSFLASCRSEQQPLEQAVSGGGEELIAFSLAEDGFFATKSIMPLPSIPSVEDGDGVLTAFEVSRMPMSEVMSTRAFTPVTLSNCNTLYADIAASGGSLLYKDVVFSRSGSRFSSGLYWPNAQSSLRFCVSNREDGRSGSTYSARSMTADAADGDIVVGAFTANKGTAASTTLGHVFACIGSLSVTPPSGCTASITSASVHAPVSGVWDFSSGSWSSTGTDEEIPLSAGTNNELCIGGPCTFSVTYELSDGEFSQSVDASGGITLTRGSYNNINVIAGAKFRYALEVYPSSVSLAHGAGTSLRVFSVTYFVPASGDEVAVSSADVTDDCTWSLSSSGVVTRTAGTSTFTADGVPGTVTATASYGGMKGTCSITHEDYATGITVRNLEASIDCDNDGSSLLDAAGEELSFTCGWSFEYCVNYASGATSGYYSFGSGPVSEETMRTTYGLAARNYVDEDVTTAGYFLDNRQYPDGDFSVTVNPNHSTSTVSLLAGYEVSVNGLSDAAELQFDQEADSYTTQYRNLKVSVTYNGKTVGTVGPSAQTIGLARSSTVEYHQIWASGYDEGWKVMSAGTPSLGESSSFLSLSSGTNLYVAANNTGKTRSGVVTASRTYQGLSATSTFTLTQEYAALDHFDVDALNMVLDITQRSFSCLGGEASVSCHGSYASRPVYEGGIYGDWSEVDTEFGGHPSSADVPSSASSWLSYNSSTHKVTVQPNYTGNQRSATVRFYYDVDNGCTCEDDDGNPGLWEGSTSETATFTQAPTTIQDIEFGLYSPSNPGGINWLLYDDVVFRPTYIKTEHGESNRTDGKLSAVWNNLTFTVSSFVLSYDNGSVLSSNGGMTMSPAASGYAGDRSITWNDVWKTLPDNTYESSGYQYPRFTHSQLFLNRSLSSLMSRWDILYNAAVTAKIGSQTRICTATGTVASVDIDDIQYRNTSMTVKSEGAPGYESLPEHVFTDMEHYSLEPYSVYYIYYYCEHDSRYKLRITGDLYKPYLGSGNWTDWEHVKLTNVMSGEDERLIDWSNTYYSVTVTEETSEAGTLILSTSGATDVESMIRFSYNKGYSIDRVVYVYPSY